MPSGCMCGLSSDDINNCNSINTTVDGSNPAPVEVGSLSHHLQGFIHPNGGWEWDF